MVRGYHVIWGCYGFWLPNDPRGSWSDHVRSADLRAFGEAKKVSTRRSVAGRAHDEATRRSAKTALRHEPMQLSGEMARVVGLAFGELGLPIHALAIMPDHVHAVIGQAGVKVEQQVRRLKQAGTVALRRSGWVPDGRPVWVRSGWFVYLNDDEAVRRAIGYVEANPTKAGLRAQRWTCVSPYRGGV